MTRFGKRRQVTPGSEQASSEDGGRHARADNPVERLSALLAADLAAADRVIHDHLFSEAALIPPIATHLVDSGGTRARALSSLAGARFFAHDGESDQTVAPGVKFIHTARLLHDDVVDESQMR